MIIKSMLLGLGLLYCAPALSCSVAPLEYYLKFYNDVTANLLSHKQIRLDQVRDLKYGKAEVIKYEWIEGDSGIDCHDKETLSLEISLSYENEESKKCQLAGKVIKTEGFFTNAPKASYKYLNVIDSCQTSLG